MRREIITATLLIASMLAGCGHTPSKQNEQEAARSPESVKDGDFKPRKTKPVKIQK
jgi:hypothetical protein